MVCSGQIENGRRGATRPLSTQQTPWSRSFIIHMAPLSPPMFANLFRYWCHHRARTISVLHSMRPTTRPTLPITRSNRMTNTRDMCLDCLVAARTDLGMNWRRTFSECFQSIFTAWRSSVSCLPLGRNQKYARLHTKQLCFS